MDSDKQDYLTDIYKPSELKLLLLKHGLRLTRERGQNFLIAPWVAERMCAEAELDKHCGAVEIGPGAGALTRKLAAAAGRVLSIELDFGFRPVLAETLSGLDNTSVVFEDAVKSDYSRLCAEHLGGLRPVVCANLPYQATSPLLGRFLECGLFDSITVMVQREVAQRMCALPGTAGRSAFSVFIQAQTDPRICFEVPPDCFFPQPKVTSAVVRLCRTKRELPPLFFKVVKAAFAQRRKTLQNALVSGFGGKAGRDCVLQAVTSCGLPPNVRGEVLDIDNFIALAQNLEEIISEE